MNRYNTDTAEWVGPPKRTIATHVPSVPVQVAAHTKTENTGLLSEVLPSAASSIAGRRTGPRIPGRRMRRKGPTKLNANRNSGLLANVANH
jgi:hypothetical protein